MYLLSTLAVRQDGYPYIPNKSVHYLQTSVPIVNPTTKCERSKSVVKLWKALVSWPRPNVILYWTLINQSALTRAYFKGQVL